MANHVEQIKAKLGIADVVGQYLKLERAGGNFKACCPFHQERTPSFFVSVARDGYYCFGCNKGGDIFTFVQEMEGLDFSGALKLLAERAGVQLELRPPGPADRLRERLYALHEAATNYFAAALGRAPEVLNYLASRGLTPETIKSWRLGFASPAAGWHGLYDHLRANFTDAEVAQSGLAIESRRPATGPNARRYFDRFRSRVIFPLFDSSGRPVAFSGRVWGEAREGEAKYINSPETPIYSKTRLLYGFDRAKTAIRRSDRAILVEGQFDVVLAHQAGSAEAIAVSGTGLTGEHLGLIGRLTRNLVMAFDGDEAGLRAAGRGAGLALEAGLEVRIAALPPGLDPADLIKSDPAAWAAATASAVHVIDFHLARLERSETDRRLRAHAIKEIVYPLVARLAHAIDQAHFVSKIGTLTGLGDDVIRREIAQAKSAGQVASTPASTIVAPPGQLTRSERIVRQLIGLCWWQNKTPAEVVGPVLAPERLATILAALEPERTRLVFEAELGYSGSESNVFEQKFSELVKNLERELIRERLGELTQQISAAERAGEAERVAPLLVECQELSRRLHTLS